MRIAVDVMGGDHAPDAILKGAIDALDVIGPSDELVLVGRPDVIEDVLRERRVNDPRVVIEPARDVIEMHEKPAQAVRAKPESSIVKMAVLGSRKHPKPADVVLSAGNTGACVSAAIMCMKRMPGVHRPGIAVTIPAFVGTVVLCDAGANPEPLPAHLFQYGIMASTYAQHVLGIASPRVGVMNIGAEEGKGSDLVRAAHDLLKAAPGINYIGNVEGRDLFDGAADVVITDGFVGNTLLKMAEGLAVSLLKAIAQEVALQDPELIMQLEPVIKRIYKKNDYHEYGGAPLLGVNGACMIAHGSSEARTIRAAIRNSRDFVATGVNEAIRKRIAEVEHVTGHAGEERAMTRPAPMEPQKIGVRIAGTGRALPTRRLSNADLVQLMDTSEDWIVQRTGIHSRFICDRSKGESCLPLATTALKNALADARMDPAELDMIILATLTEEMPSPPTSCLLAAAVGSGPCAAYDLSGACSGFVFALNTAWSMIRCGLHRNVAVVGADTLSSYMEYNDHGRTTAILFGDAAGAAILRATDDVSKGLIAQAMHTDGSRWADLYIPLENKHFPESDPVEQAMIGRLHMNGKSVFKFAVGTFPGVIEETLKQANLRADEVDHFICHQSNARILEAARERFGLPHEKLYVNIDRYGNTVAASVPLCLDELREQGRVREGQRVMFVAFGAGLTWGTSLWQL